MMKPSAGYLAALYLGLIVMLASCIHPVQSAQFQITPQESDESDSRSLIYDLSDSHTNHHHQQHGHHHQLDAPRYYKLNELLYKSRPRHSAASNNEDEEDDSDRNRGDTSRGHSLNPTSNLRPLDGGTPQVGSSRRAIGSGADDDDEDNESSLDGLISDMQSRGAFERADGDKTGVTYESESAGREAALGSAGGGTARAAMVDRAVGAQDEASIQRKSTNLSEEDSSGLVEASARLRKHGRSKW